MRVVRPGTWPEGKSTGPERLMNMIKRLPFVRRQIKDICIGEAADFLESDLKWFQVG